MLLDSAKNCKKTNFILYAQFCLAFRILSQAQAIKLHKDFVALYKLFINIQLFEYVNYVVKYLKAYFV